MDGAPTSLAGKGGPPAQSPPYPVEVRGLPLNHDETVVEWGTQSCGWLMTGPPAWLCSLGGDNPALDGLA